MRTAVVGAYQRDYDLLLAQDCITESLDGNGETVSMPRALVVQPHAAKYADPIRFRAGEHIFVHRADFEFPGWYWCSLSDGKEGWVHAQFLSQVDGVAIATEDYSALEVTVCVGAAVEVGECVGGWAYVTTDSGTTGWVPETSLQLSSRST